MNLGIMLPLGESFENLSKSGQDDLFKNFYIKHFSKSFNKVYIFSYKNEQIRDLPKNVYLIPNKFKLHRYFYGLFLPLLVKKSLQDCNVLRIYHLSGCLPAIIAKFLYGKQFVFNFAYDYERFALLDKKIFQYVLFKFLKSFAVFSASKLFVANKILLKMINSDKCYYLPNGVDTKQFYPKIKEGNMPLQILSIGRLEIQKNHLALIEALVGLEIELKIVGNGLLFQKLINLATKKNVRLKIVKKIIHSKLPEVYRKADIFILPSLIEGHPKVLLEAMASGMPVIASKISGVEDIIKDQENGLFCNPNKESIRKKLLVLINNLTLKKKIAKNARLTILEKFDLNKLIIDEITVIKSVINN